MTQINLTTYQKKIIKDYKLRVRTYQEHKRIFNSFKNNKNEPDLNKLKEIVTLSSRLLSDETSDETITLESIKDIAREDETFFSTIELDSQKLHLQISSLPEGDVRNDLILFLGKLVHISDKNQKIIIINEKISILLTNLNIIIQKEKGLLEQEFSLLKNPEINISILEEYILILGSFLKEEKFDFLDPFIALTNQNLKLRVILNKARLELIDIKRIKIDLRELNPAQAEEYMAIILGLIPKEGETFNFLDRFFNYFQLKKLFLSLKNESDLILSSTRDPLTGLRNRSALEEDIFKLTKTASRGGALAVCFFDIDHFKDFNDTYGHLVGDIALKILGNVLNNLRSTEVAYRFGGEEFVILFDSRSEYDSVKNIIERIRAEITKRAEQEKQNNPLFKVVEVKLTLSAGLAFKQFANSSYKSFNNDDLLRISNQIQKLADAQLYKAKEAGRNRLKSVLIPPDQNL